MCRCKIYSSSSSFWFNGSGYSDPTAGAALDRIDRELKQKAKAEKQKEEKKAS